MSVYLLLVLCVYIVFSFENFVDAATFTSAYILAVHNLRHDIGSTIVCADGVLCHSIDLGRTLMLFVLFHGYSKSHFSLFFRFFLHFISF